MFCSCQTYPVCRWACVHLFQPARTYAPLRVQHACKFPTQMVWDIVVRTKHRASHSPHRSFKASQSHRFERSKTICVKIQSCGPAETPGDAEMFHTREDSVRAVPVSSSSEATWQMLRRSVCVCVCVRVAQNRWRAVCSSPTATPLRSVCSGASGSARSAVRSD